MAHVGMLGEIPFEVSDRAILTVSGLEWSGTARYSTHQRHLYDAMTEYAGTEPDEISLEITLSEYLGVNPQAVLTQIWKYERTGEMLPLAIGNKAYGKYRWNIKSHKVTAKTFDGAGNITHCSLTLNLQEALYW